MKSLTETVERQAKVIEATAKNGEDGVYEKLRERDSRKLNVVMHGMDEAEDHVKGRGRWDGIYRAVSTCSKH